VKAEFRFAYPLLLSSLTRSFKIFTPFTVWQATLLGLSSAPLMATIKPFAALRPDPKLASRLCELPYDVMSSEEARELAAGNPLSFLHVSKPEIDLAPGTNIYSPEVYAKAVENFKKLVGGDALQQDDRLGFYLYRQVMGAHAQVGLVAVASCEEYRNGRIKKHELTRPEKEDDRVRHVEVLNAQTGPAFLVYRANPAMDEWVTRQTAVEPAVDFTAKDGVRHTGWAVHDPVEIRKVEAIFEGIDALYIADGHHRSAAAARVFEARRGAGHSAWFLSVIFPDTQVQILPYNRVLKDLNGLSPAALLEKLDGVFIIEPKGAATPNRKHQLGLYLEGAWRTLHFRPRFAATSDPVERLDATLLQKYVLAPIFGIDDPRTSQRIQFVGGIRGTAELEKLVNQGSYACAFSLYPTSVEDLMAVADAGGLMPPKSTWFEPKLRDGMFSHLI
jgi:uncharacterized protein (DUF1015 family)